MDGKRNPFVTVCQLHNGFLAVGQIAHYPLAVPRPLPVLYADDIQAVTYGSARIILVYLTVHGQGNENTGSILVAEHKAGPGILALCLRKRNICRGVDAVGINPGIYQPSFDVRVTKTHLSSVQL